MRDTIYIIAIIILLFAVGYLIGVVYDKRRRDIIKLLIKQDLLPPPAENTNWMKGGTCYMGDGSFGKVNGNYCQQTIVL